MPVRRRYGDVLRCLMVSIAVLCHSTLISAAQGKPDCAVFVTNYMQRGLPSTLPQEGPKCLSIFASPGEYEPCTFSIRANEDMRKVSVAVSDPKFGSAVISGSNIVVRKVEVSDYTAASGKHVIAESYLPRFNSVDIPKDTTQRFWLTIHTPESAAPGVYTGKVTLKLDGKPFDALDLRLEVLPVKLLDPRDISFFMYNTVGFEPLFARNLEYQRKCFLDMKAHGMNSATAYMWPAKRADGSVDLRKQHNLDGLPAIPQMETMLDTGLIAPGRPVLWIGAAEYGDLATYEAVYAEAKKRNWPEIIFYVVDEPVTKPQQERAIEILGKIAEFKKSHPDLRIRTATAINGVAIREVGNHYDIWICVMGDVSSFVDRARRLGKELWCYECTLGVVDAATARYCYGFLAWRTGVKGASFWAYADVPGAYGSNIWDSSRNTGLAVQSFVRPTPGEPVPSIGWEACREGVDDYRYLTTLRAAIAEAFAAGRNREALAAQRVLDDFTSRINIDNYTKSFLAACKGEENQSTDSYIFNRPPPEPDITAEGWNEMRYQLAKETVKLDLPM